MKERIETTRHYTFEEFNKIIRESLKVPDGFSVENIWSRHRIGTDECEEGIFVKLVKKS